MGVIPIPESVVDIKKLDKVVRKYMCHFRMLVFGTVDCIHEGQYTTLNIRRYVTGNESLQIIPHILQQYSNVLISQETEFSLTIGSNAVFKKLSDEWEAKAKQIDTLLTQQTIQLSLPRITNFRYRPPITLTTVLQNLTTPPNLDEYEIPATVEHNNLLKEIYQLANNVIELIPDSPTLVELSTFNLVNEILLRAYRQLIRDLTFVRLYLQSEELMCSYASYECHCDDSFRYCPVRLGRDLIPVAPVNLSTRPTPND